MATELEGIGGFYAADGWSLGALVAPEEVFDTGAATVPVESGLVSGGAADFAGTFSGFLPTDPLNMANDTLPLPPGADGSVPSTALSTTDAPGMAAPVVAPLTATNTGDDEAEGFLRGSIQLAAGGLGNSSSSTPGMSPASDAVNSLPTGNTSAALDNAPSQAGYGAESSGGLLGSGGQGDPGSDAPSGGATTFTVTVPGSGLVFNNTITSGFTAAFEQDIIDAEDSLAGHWTNSVTLKLDFSGANGGDDGDLASNSWPSFVNVSYATLKSALAAHDQGSIFAADAVAALPVTDPNPAGGNDWSLPEAYARMLGLSNSTPSVDDTVTLNTFYLSDSSVGQDVINAITHEISEGAMGRVGGLGDQNNAWSTMDLFRYAASGQPDYTDGRDNTATYFSYNGGQTLSASAGLSFNNQYSDNQATGLVHENGGDTADFNELDVFGVGEPGEAFTLSQTDIEMMDVLGWFPVVPVVPPSTPAGTDADMILQDGNTGNFQIWDLGGNAILAAFPMGQIGSSWQFAGLGDFNGTDTTDMMMRDTSTGNIDVFDIANSQMTGAATIGNLNSSWQFAGFGDFSGLFNSSTPETDMIMSNTNNGVLQVFDIQNNQIAGSAMLGQVGLSWQVAGVGDFSGIPNEADFIMRDLSTGAIDYFDVQHNQLIGGSALGSIGLEWQIGGVGDFSTNPNESDIIIRNTNTGALQYFDVQNNKIVSGGSLGQIGLEWQFAGFTNITGNSNETDMIMHNTSTGAFEYFDIRNNQIVGAGSLGAAGTNWHPLGVADPPVNPAAQMSAMSFMG